MSQNSSLEEQSRTILDDIKHKTEIPLEDFLDTFVPKLPGNLELDALKQRMDELGAWEEFSLPPAKKSDSEDAIFKRLTTLFDKMVEAVGSLAKNDKKNPRPMQQWSFTTAPRSMPTTTERPSTFRPDGVFYRKGVPNPESCSYYDIALTVEFKKRGGGANSADISKVIYSMKYIMAVDARRRFIFGITVENDKMRLWYANRAMLIGSMPLDIIKNKGHLIRVFCLAYASDLEMGFDPTVKYLEGDAYHINVGDTKYQTTDKLHDAGSDLLLSRGTRAFKVKKVDDPQGTPYVLKDIWVEKDRIPEHQIYENIITDVRLQYSEEDVRTVQQHLLTPVDNVFVRFNGIEDDTEIQSLTLNSSKLIPLPIVTPSHGPAINSKTYPTRSDMEVEADQDINRTVRKLENTRHRRHYRIGFKECAIPMHKVTTMKGVFTILADLIKVLQFIHGSGWIHRDISVGNVYLFDERGILADLEYAKSTNDTSQHDVRIGTIDFMATEVIRLKYLFRPTTVSLLVLDGSKKKVEPLPFRYYAAHDIESVWWLGVWMLFFFKPKDYPEPEDDSLRRQREASLVFPGTLREYAGRFVYFYRTGEFTDSTYLWTSEEFSYAIKVFDVLRAHLLDLYEEIEKIFPDGLSKLSAKADRRNTNEAFPGGPTRDIYKHIRDIFLKAMERYDELNTEIEPFKVSERDGNRLKMGEQTSTPGSEKRGSDHGVAEEAGKGKGKKTNKRQRRR